MLMKNLMLTLVLTGCTFASYAQEYRFVAKDSSLASQLCVQAANNEKIGVKHVMRMLYGDSSSALAVNTVRCNDLSLAMFSFKYGATDTFKYLNRMSYNENKVIPSTHIKDIVLQPNDETKAPVTVYVLAKR
jgi:hypothetical protein